MPVASMVVDSMQAIRRSSEACAAEVCRMHAALDVMEMVRDTPHIKSCSHSLPSAKAVKASARFVDPSGAYWRNDGKSTMQATFRAAEDSSGAVAAQTGDTILKILSGCAGEGDAQASEAIAADQTVEGGQKPSPHDSLLRMAAIVDALDAEQKLMVGAEQQRR